MLSFRKVKELFATKFHSVTIAVAMTFATQKSQSRVVSTKCGTRLMSFSSNTMRELIPKPMRETKKNLAYSTPTSLEVLFHVHTRLRK